METAADLFRSFKQLPHLIDINFFYIVAPFFNIIDVFVFTVTFSKANEPIPTIQSKSAAIPKSPVQFSSSANISICRI